MWNVASALSISFFSSYLREELAFPFTVISIFTIVGSLSRILLSPILGRIADKYSFSFSMTIAFVLAAFGFLAIVFTSPETKWLYIAYSCLNGFAMAGINSGVINFVYDYVEPADRAAAMGTKNALGGILAFLTALLSGSILSDIQSAGGIELFGITIYAQQFLALLSFFATVLLIIYMRVVIAPMKRVSNSEQSL
jgi:MFS family permease